MLNGHRDTVSINGGKRQHHRHAQRHGHADVADRSARRHRQRRQFQRRAWVLLLARALASAEHWTTPGAVDASTDAERASRNETTSSIQHKSFADLSSAARRAQDAAVWDHGDRSQLHTAAAPAAFQARGSTAHRTSTLGGSTARGGASREITGQARGSSGIVSAEGDRFESIAERKLRRAPARIRGAAQTAHPSRPCGQSAQWNGQAEQEKARRTAASAPAPLSLCQSLRQLAIPVMGALLLVLGGMKRDACPA